MANPTPAVVNDIRGDVIALKRDRIISAAVDLFYDRGYEHSTLEAVAERLGVTKPFIYSYFRSKRELLSKICGMAIESSLLALNQVMDIDERPPEKLRRLSRDFVIAVLQNQKPLAIFAREEKNLDPEDFERISEMRREFDRKIAQLLNEGIAGGDFDVPDIRLASLAIDGMVSWTSTWYRPQGRFSIAEVGDHISELIMKLVRRETPAA